MQKCAEGKFRDSLKLSSLEEQFAASMPIGLVPAYGWRQSALRGVGVPHNGTIIDIRRCGVIIAPLGRTYRDNLHANPARKTIRCSRPRLHVSRARRANSQRHC